MPFIMIMMTANIVSRASVGSVAPSSMTAAISETSMTITEMVRISVPSGSPSNSANASAWRTTPKMQQAIAVSSQTNSTPRSMSCAGSASQTLP